jgi:hypothetical protein
MKTLTEQENLQETFERLYEMANLYKMDTNLPVNLWLDEMGQDRIVEHNIARMKFQGDSSDKLNYQNLIPISISNNPEILLKNPPAISSKLINSVKNFIIHNRDILEQHFNHKITTKQLYPKLRIQGYYSILNILEIIPNEFQELIS